TPGARDVVGGCRGLSVRQARSIALPRSGKGPRTGHDAIPGREIVPARSVRLSPRAVTAPVAAIAGAKGRGPIALTRLLRPHSVAIVGISPEPGSLGATVLGNLERLGFAGDIHLVSR